MGFSCVFRNLGVHTYEVASSYGSVLADNIRAARARRGLKLEDLAARMRALGYSAWLRQTVANVEKGKRRVTAEEVYGLAWALETSMPALLAPAEDLRSVQFPSGAEVTGEAAAVLAGMGANPQAIAWNGDDPTFIEPDLRTALEQLFGRGLLRQKYPASRPPDDPTAYRA